MPRLTHVHVDPEHNPPFTPTIADCCRAWKQIKQHSPGELILVPWGQHSFLTFSDDAKLCGEIALGRNLNDSVTRDVEACPVRQLSRYDDTVHRLTGIIQTNVVSPLNEFLIPKPSTTRKEEASDVVTHSKCSPGDCESRPASNLPAQTNH